MTRPNALEALFAAVLLAIQAAPDQHKDKVCWMYAQAFEALGVTAEELTIVYALSPILNSGVKA